jgi:hypothetical protein
VSSPYFSVHRSTPKENVNTQQCAEMKATLQPETRVGIESGARELTEELHLAQLRNP